MRTACLVFVLAAGAMTLPVSSGAEGLPGTDDVLGTVTSTAGTVTSTVDGVTSGVASTSGAASAAADTAAASLTGAASPTGGVTDPGSTDLTGSGSSSSSQSTTGETSQGSGNQNARSGRASPGRSYKSRFDRLPRRAELLLERIELGRHVAANLRRLEALLASRPGLRVSVLQSIRAELNHLRRGGISPSERTKARHLRAVRRALRPGAGALPETDAHAGPAALPGLAVQTESTFGASGESDSRMTSKTNPPEAGVSSAPGPNGSFLGRLPGLGGGSRTWINAFFYALFWVVVTVLLAFLAREFRSALR
jgi:hypothetical protein